MSLGAGQGGGVDVATRGLGDNAHHANGPATAAPPWTSFDELSQFLSAAFSTGLNTGYRGWRKPSQRISSKLLTAITAAGCIVENTSIFSVAFLLLLVFNEVRLHRKLCVPKLLEKLSLRIEPL